MLAAGDRHSPIRLQLGIPANIIGNHRLFQPAQVEGFEQGEHAFGVVQGPSHVGIGHHVDLVSYRLAYCADEVQVALHPLGSINRTPAEAQLHGLVPFTFVSLRFECQLFQRA